MGEVAGRISNRACVYLGNQDTLLEAWEKSGDSFKIAKLSFLGKVCLLCDFFIICPFFMSE